MHRDVDPAIDEEGNTDCKAVSASDSLIPSTQVSEQARTHARTPACFAISQRYTFFRGDIARASRRVCRLSRLASFEKFLRH